MKDHGWFSGPPPYVGWWNASVNKSPTAWRWWNGRGWSDVAREHCGQDFAASLALCRAREWQTIFWRHYYPKNARVPRIDPREKS